MGLNSKGPLDLKTISVNDVVRSVGTVPNSQTRIDGETAAFSMAVKAACTVENGLARSPIVPVESLPLGSTGAVWLERNGLLAAPPIVNPANENAEKLRS